jgi:hypothetical protein
MMEFYVTETAMLLNEPIVDASPSSAGDPEYQPPDPAPPTFPDPTQPQPEEPTEPELPPSEPPPDSKPPAPSARQAQLISCSHD